MDSKKKWVDVKPCKSKAQTFWVERRLILPPAVFGLSLGVVTLNCLRAQSWTSQGSAVHHKPLCPSGNLCYFLRLDAQDGRELTPEPVDMPQLFHLKNSKGNWCPLSSISKNHPKLKDHLNLKMVHSNKPGRKLRSPSWPWSFFEISPRWWAGQSLHLTKSWKFQEPRFRHL